MVFVDKIGIYHYLKKLNNSMLKDTYFKIKQKKPRSYMDILILSCCIDEMKKRGIINDN